MLFCMQSLNTTNKPLLQVPFLGAIVNKIPQRDHAILSSQLRRRFSEGGIPLLGAIPDVRCRLLLAGLSPSLYVCTAQAQSLLKRNLNPGTRVRQNLNNLASQSPVLRSVRLDEVKEALNADVLFSRCAVAFVMSDSNATFMINSKLSKPQNTPLLHAHAHSTGCLDEEYFYVIPVAQPPACKLLLSHQSK